MALDIDVTQAVMGLRGQQQLVRAVLGASAADEQRWLEWKSTLDLTTAHGYFTVSKAILGFANRMPDTAAQWAQGHAYLLVGVEPGELHGVSQIDIEKLDPGLARYVGQDLRYQLTYVPFDEGNGTRHVLFVDIAPPQWGETIYTLQKDYDRARAGTIFHRYPGRTEPAGAKEIVALCERVRHRDPGINVILNPGASAVAVVETDPARHEQILQTVRGRLLAQLPPVADTSPPRGEPVELPLRLPGTGSKTGSRGTSIRDLATLEERQRSGEPLTAAETRQLEEAKRATAGIADQLRAATAGLLAAGLLNTDAQPGKKFRDQVELYIAEVQRKLPKVLTRAIATQCAPLRLELHNPTDNFLAEVQVIIELPPTVRALVPDSHQTPITWREEPAAYGTVTPWASLIAPITSYHPQILRTPLYTPHTPELESTEDTLTVRYAPVDLRPHGRAVLDGVTAYTDPRHTDPVAAHWTATARNMAGRISGTMTLQLTSAEVDLTALVPSTGRTS